MTSAKVVETSDSNNSSFQNYPYSWVQTIYYITSFIPWFLKPTFVLLRTIYYSILKRAIGNTAETGCSVAVFLIKTLLPMKSSNKWSAYIESKMNKCMNNYI